MDYSHKKLTVVSKNLIPMCILRILEDHSNAEHKLTQDDIKGYLNREYSVEKIERKSIGRSVARLHDEFQIEIETDNEGSWLDERTFSDEELQLLIDTVFTSRFLSKKDSKKLIDKLSLLGNDFFKSHVNYTYSMDGLDKSESASLMYNINFIASAIEHKCQIEFDYNKYGVDKKLHKTSHHTVSPYRLIVHNQRYYIMGFHEDFKNMIYYRLDHISGINILKKVPATPIRSIPGWEGGITNKNMAMSMPYMFSDEHKLVTFYATANAVDQMFDWLGKDIDIVEIQDEGDDKVQITLKTSPNAMKYFALQYLEQIEIIKPVELRKEVSDLVKAAAQKYK